MTHKLTIPPTNPLINHQNKQPTNQPNKKTTSPPINQFQGVVPMSFMEPEVALPCSQQLATCSYAQPH
jgi:hypothetical protein